MSDTVRPHRRQAHQAPPSLGFSRQEHWSGPPFPSPVRESEVAQLWTLFFWAPKSLEMATAAMKLKDTHSLEVSYDQPR